MFLRPQYPLSMQNLIQRERERKSNKYKFGGRHISDALLFNVFEATAATAFIRVRHPSLFYPSLFTSNVIAPPHPRCHRGSFSVTAALMHSLALQSFVFFPQIVSYQLGSADRHCLLCDRYFLPARVKTSCTNIWTDRRTTSLKYHSHPCRLRSILVLCHGFRCLASEKAKIKRCIAS